MYKKDYAFCQHSPGVCFQKTTTVQFLAMPVFVPTDQVGWSRPCKSTWPTNANTEI